MWAIIPYRLLILLIFQQTMWSIAEGDCKFFFGANATLVAIESEEEWEFLKIKLESYGIENQFK